jgi:NAD-dependent dihydropyrimidine dehydrogenase PreA subunit
MPFCKNSFCETFGVPQAAYLVIDRIVSPVEQAVCVRRGSEVFTVDDVARIVEEAHLAIPDAASFTVAAYRRGIFAREGELVSPHVGEPAAGPVDNPYPGTPADVPRIRYRLSNFYNRLDIFAVSETETYRAFDKAVRQSLNDWYFDAYYAALDIAPDRPPTLDAVLTLDQTLARIAAETRQAYLAPCDCRSLGGEGMEENCGKPLLTCVSYRTGVNTFADRGVSRPITKEQAKQVVLDADAAGLMHTANPNGICNCCADCCFLSRARIRRNAALGSAEAGGGALLPWPTRGGTVRLDAEKCVGCGGCIGRCPFGLFAADGGGRVAVRSGQCAGCGLCVQTCPAQALALQEG